MKFILTEQALLEDIESMKKYYPNIPEEQFMESVVSNKIRFRLVEDNELEKRAMKHKKKQKGLSPFGYFPDYDKGVDAFNGLSNTSFDSSSMESASMGESLNKELYRLILAIKNQFPLILLILILKFRKLLQNLNLNSF